MKKAIYNIVFTSGDQKMNHTRIFEDNHTHDEVFDWMVGIKRKIESENNGLCCLTNIQKV